MESCRCALHGRLHRVLGKRSKPSAELQRLYSSICNLENSASTAEALGSVASNHTPVRRTEGTTLQTQLNKPKCRQPTTLKIPHYGGTASALRRYCSYFISPQCGIRAVVPESKIYSRHLRICRVSSALWFTIRERRSRWPLLTLSPMPFIYFHRESLYAVWLT